MYFDSHCHLTPEAFGSPEGVDAAVQRALDAGVTRMVTIGSGYGATSARDAIDLARRNEHVWCSVGIHPHDAKEWTDEVEAELRALAADPRCVAFGEMGLDFYYDLSDREVQRRVLRREIAVARELGLPIILHDRDAGDEVLRIVAEEGGFEGAGVLWHCFTGDVAYMRRIVEHGGWISIPGIVTFKKAGAMRDVATEVPLDRLLIETDSPFLTPVPFRGKRNEPARVVHVAERVAELRGLAVDELAAATTANALRFYGLGGADPVA